MLNVSGLTKRFHSGEPAVDDLSFSVSPGEVYCLLGGPGAGKTTTTRMLLGLLSPSAGHIRIGGDEQSDPIGLRSRISFVSGAGDLCRASTVLQNLAFFSALGNGHRVGTRAERLNALRDMGVPERAFHQRLDSLPRDLTVAVWLAVAWLRQTPVLLLDEPTRGFGTRAIADFQRHLRAFQVRGQAIVMATGDVLLASQIADRIGVLKRGRKSAERTRAEVLSLTLTELYLDYVGKAPIRAAAEPLELPTRVYS